MKTNDLRHSITSTDKEGNPMYINIRLNDECNNGHQDFSITANIYEKGKPKTDRYYIMGGCCHDEILATNPKLKIFIDLHLCDYKGIPMYAVENGFYHLREGLGNVKPEEASFKDKFCDYYRITSEQFNHLNACKNKIQYAIALKELGILNQWEKQANEAIKQLEQWTGNEFVIDSRKSQYIAPTEAELKEEAERQASGYYSAEAEQERHQALALRQSIIDERDKNIQDIKDEYSIKLQVLDIAGTKALRNCIFYKHTKRVAFNWRDGDKISQDNIDKLKSELKLPEGVTFD